MTRPDAAYVFRARFRLDPDGVRADPATFETTVERPADPPGTEGWLFFRDALGNISYSPTTGRPWT